MCDIVSFPRESANQGDNSCSSLPAELGGIGEFETKFEEICKKIWEEIIQTEVSLGGSPTINVTLVQILNKLKLLETGACQSAVNGKDNVGWKWGLKENIGSSALSGSCWITKVGQSFDSWASPVAEKTCPRYQGSAGSIFSFFLGMSPQKDKAVSSKK